MADNLQNTAVYTDFSGLAELRRASKSGGEDSIRAVAKQFEALYMQMVLKSMRDAIPVEGMLNSSESKTYMDMYDKQLSLHLSQSGGFGLSEVLVRQLTGKGINDSVQVKKSINHYIKSSLPVSVQSPGPHVSVEPVKTASASAPTIPATVPVTESVTRQEKVEKETINPATPEDFVRFLWSHAKEAAKKYGLNAKAMVAQAALETGWGKHIIKDAEGASTNNLYGIKAGASWTGEKVHVPTLEYKDGVFSKETGAFRAYGSIAGSIQDYAKFISNSPRYASLKEHVDNPELYAEHLQKAGYATDPNYADKIKKILRSGILENALGSPSI